MQIKRIFSMKDFSRSLWKPLFELNYWLNRERKVTQLMKLVHCSKKDQHNPDGCQTADSAISMQIILRIISSNFTL